MGEVPSKIDGKSIMTKIKEKILHLSAISPVANGKSTEGNSSSDDGALDNSWPPWSDQ